LTAHLLRSSSFAEAPLRAREEPVLVVSRAAAESSAAALAALPVDLPPMSAPPAGEPVAAMSAMALPPVVPAVASAEPAASVEPTPGVRVPSKRELMAALRATPVSMFSASWCPHCLRARRFFQTYGLSVVDHDIDADARAAAELERRSGGKAVPLIDVDGLVLRGFDERATMQAVVASVERRLGVTGVKLSVASVSN